MGLDASTTTIGICILDDADPISVIYLDFYKPNKENGIIQMLVSARKHIFDVAKQYNVDIFVIEEYIRFMKGASSAATVIPLAILNTTLRLSIFDEFGKEPEALNVLKIRHCLKLDKKIPAKEDIPDLVAHHLGLKEFPWRKRISRKKEVVMVESYDMADAIAVALTKIKLSRIPAKIKKVNKSAKPLAKKNSI
jgi:Holliday junction resolvasome RuvABC endonuclease subunit